MSVSDQHQEQGLTKVPSEYAQLLQSRPYDDLLKMHRDNMTMIGEKSSRVITCIGHVIATRDFKEPVRRVQEAVVLGQMQSLIEKECKERFPDRDAPKIHYEDVGWGLIKGITQGMIALGANGHTAGELLAPLVHNRI